ncbi:MAG: putative lumazine-binding protein [Sphingobacteriaceae bacterium]|jgi:hypothetical protein|nr:putative lumazine-binding protein [Sphingobacteriaceae bacterium]
MKTLYAAALALTFSLMAFAARANGTRAEKFSMKYTISTFVDAFAHGKISGLAQILDDKVKFTSSRGEKVLTYNKADILKMLKNIQGVEQNCKTEYSTIENLPGQIMMKVNMIYSSFTKSNYVTLSDTREGWKVTNISSIFEN